MSTTAGRISFGTKILIMVLASSIGLAVITSAIALKLYVGSYQSFIELYKKSLYSDFDNQARTQVETATSMLQRLNDRHQKGEISLEEAKNWAPTYSGNCAMPARTVISGRIPPMV